MPRGYTTELTEEVIAKIKELHANGVWVKQISKEVQVPYTKVCDILNPKQEKVVITSKILSDIEREILELTPKELSKKYNRSWGDMRSLLKSLGWVLPKEWEELKHEEYKEKIQQYLNCNMSFKDIGDKLGLDANRIYYICRKLGLYKRPKVKGAETVCSNEKEVAKSYQEILKETADSIRDKLRKQFS